MRAAPQRRPPTARVVLSRVGGIGGGEGAAAVALVGRMAGPGGDVTVDAGLAHQRLARAVLARRADDLRAVTENQPTPLEDPRALFADPATGARTAATATARGGRVEERRLRASAELAGYSAWPGRQQALCLGRTVTL
jgi:hypothetical protein